MLIFPAQLRSRLEANRKFPQGFPALSLPNNNNESAFGSITIFHATFPNMEMIIFLEVPSCESRKAAQKKAKVL